MTAVKYDESQHYGCLCEWWKGHGMEPYQTSRLPKNGYVVEGVAAAFFYTTDTDTAILEYCVSNPAASRSDVYDAIADITESCQKKAHELGYTQMYCLTHVPGIIEYAKRVPGSRVSKRGDRAFVQGPTRRD